MTDISRVVVQMRNGGRLNIPFSPEVADKFFQFLKETAGREGIERAFWAAPDLFIDSSEVQSAQRVLTFGDAP